MLRRLKLMRAQIPSFAVLGQPEFGSQILDRRFNPAAQESRSSSFVGAAGACVGGATPCGRVPTGGGRYKPKRWLRLTWAVLRARRGWDPRGRESTLTGTDSQLGVLQRPNESQVFLVSSEFTFTPFCFLVWGIRFCSLQKCATPAFPPHRCPPPSVARAPPPVSLYNSLLQRSNHADHAKTPLLG